MCAASASNAERAGREAHDRLDGREPGHERQRDPERASLSTVCVHARTVTRGN